MAVDGEILNGEGETMNGGWDVSKGGVRIVVEVATAWAVTKALLPVRLVGSVWATPWFARIVVLPITRVVGKVFKSGTGGKATGAAGVGAASAGTAPKSVESLSTSGTRSKQR